MQQTVITEALELPGLSKHSGLSRLSGSSLAHAVIPPAIESRVSLADEGPDPVDDPEQKGCTKPKQNPAIQRL